MLKRTLSTVVERVKHLWNRSASESEDGGGESDAGPDLFECEGCGAVFISKPSECSNCEGDEFSNAGSF